LSNIKSNYRKEEKFYFFFHIKSLFLLMKPRVMSLVIFTCLVGMVIAPGNIDLYGNFASLVIVAVGAGASGMLNMWYDSDIDAIMSRTCLRPIPSGQLKRQEALFYGIILSVFLFYLCIILQIFISILIGFYNLFLRIHLYNMVKKKDTTKYSYRRCGRSISSSDWLGNFCQYHFYRTTHSFLIIFLVHLPTFGR